MNKPQLRRSWNPHGLTLMELVVVLAMVGMIATVTPALLRRFLSKHAPELAAVNTVQCSPRTYASLPSLLEPIKETLKGWNARGTAAVPWQKKKEAREYLKTQYQTPSGPGVQWGLNVISGKQWSRPSLAHPPGSAILKGGLMLWITELEDQATRRVKQSFRVLGNDGVTTRYSLVWDNQTLGQVHSFLWPCGAVTEDRVLTLGFFQQGVQGGRRAIASTPSGMTTGYIKSFVDGNEWKNDMQYIPCEKGPGRVTSTRGEMGFCFQGSVYSPGAKPEKFSFQEAKPDEDTLELALGKRILIELNQSQN